MNTKTSDSKISVNEGESSKIPLLKFNGRVQSSTFDEKQKEFGDLCNNLYQLIRNNKKYFNEVFIFFSARVLPYLPEEKRERQFFLTTLKASIKSMGYSEEETVVHLSIFDDILNLPKNKFEDFRGFFLEEFLKRKFEEKCGIFEGVFSEEVVSFDNCNVFTGFSSNSDIDLIKLTSKSQILNRSEFDNVSRFEGFECKSSIVNFMKSIYSKKPYKKSIKSRNKIIYMMEMNNALEVSFPEAEILHYIIGYESLKTDDKKSIEEDIKKIKFRNQYSTSERSSLMKLQELFNLKKFLMLGRVELNTLLYS